VCRNDGPFIHGGKALRKARYNECVLVLLGLIIGFYSIACEPVEKKQAGDLVVNELKTHFFLQEVLDLIGNYGDRAKAKEYFTAHQDKFHFIGSERQGEMFVDGYKVRDRGSMIGISLFFHEDKQTLVMVNVAIHPEAVKRAINLIKLSFDSVDAQGRTPSTGAKLYFMGLHPLRGSRVLKIMVRKDLLQNGALYSIFYAISATE
jgi:hypothetical protein